MTFEVLNEAMRKLDHYVMLKSFQNLQRIVGTKADDIAFEEVRRQADANAKRISKLEDSIVELKWQSTAQSTSIEKN